MSDVHTLKSWPEFFEAIIRGEKLHEIRRTSDRQFRTGDILHLREYDPNADRYSGRECTVQVTYITSRENECALSPHALSDGFCILSIKLI